MKAEYASSEKSGMSMVFVEEALDRQLAPVFDRFEADRDSLIPVLQAVQDELGYLPPEAVSRVAGFLNVPVSNVYGVVTFYTQFYQTPQGRHKIKVCQGTACHVKGSADIVAAISRKLGIKPGETTEDFELSLESVACFGSCALAPVVVVDSKVYGNITPESALELLEQLQ